MKQPKTWPCFLVLENNGTYYNIWCLKFLINKLYNWGFKNIMSYRFGLLCIFFLSFQLLILKSWIAIMLCSNLTTLRRFIYQICSLLFSFHFVHFKTFQCAKVFKHPAYLFIYFLTYDFLKPALQLSYSSEFYSANKG